LYPHTPPQIIFISMSTLNLEFGFNVPRRLIYEALIEPQYHLH